MSSKLAVPLLKRSLYGRRQSRPLKDHKSHLWHNLLPSLHFDARLCNSLSFWQEKFVCLEIGFGSGEHLYEQAYTHPDRFYVGCEPFVNGVASLLQKIESRPVSNLFLFPDDAGILLSKLPEACLDQVYLLFADPWPKKRHHKRRFVQLDRLVEIHRVLKPQGIWRIATDHSGYQEWILEIFSSSEGKRLFVQTRDDIWSRPCLEGWPMTRYEQKALQQERHCLYLEYRKM